uniref:DRBM domain-containing protein n=1 Tax=Anopheles minimus TaxID=112268 RepID=A0A182W4W3_9DIPT
MITLQRYAFMICFVLRQQSAGTVPLKMEVVDQQPPEMDVPMEAVKQQLPTETMSSEGSDTTQEGGSNIRAEVKESRHFIKKPLNALERKRCEKERKARQLRRLRKWLMPKNAIVALHELQGPGMAEFTLNTNGQETKAEIVINNVKYEATAPNKNQAKAKASEKALRDLIFAQMTRLKHQRTASLKQESTATTDNVDGVPARVESTDGTESLETEDLPMEHLASFALHKLFAQWEAEGFEVPFLKTSRPKTTTQSVAPAENGAASTSVMPKVTKTVADLPPNATKRHPTALFAYMRPQIAYEDLGSNNDQANREFKAGLRSDGHYFIGKGRSKKLARKAAAIDACRELFGVVFDESVLLG